MERLTVVVVEVTVVNHKKPINTTGAVPLESYTSSRNVSVSPDHYQVARGRKLTFRLGHADALAGTIREVADGGPDPSPCYGETGIPSVFLQAKISEFASCELCFLLWNDFSRF